MKKITLSFILFISMLKTTHAEEYISQWISANGGCIKSFNSLQFSLNPVDGRFLGRLATEWTDQTLENYRETFARCMFEVNTSGRSTPRPTIAWRDWDPGKRASQQAENEVRRRFVEPGHSEARARFEQQQAQQRLAAQSAREQAIRAAQEREAAALAAVEAKARSEESARLAAETADANRRAAGELKQQAEREEGLLAEAKRVATEAERELSEAQQRLARVRQLRQEEEARSEEARRRIAVVEKQAQEPAARPDPPRAEPVPTPVPRKQESDIGTETGTCAINLQTFSRINLGISYRNTVRIIGCEGREQGSIRVGGSTIKSYTWEGGLFVRMMLQYDNNRLTSKHQIGLD